MKLILIVMLLVIVALPGKAQMLVRTSSEIKISPVSFEPRSSSLEYFGRNNFSQTIYWRKRYRTVNLEYGEGQAEKTVYNFHSVYFRDSLWGATLYGLDIDLMAEHFEKKKANKFRYWNKLRLGGVILLEVNPKAKAMPLEDSWRYLDMEFYFNYLHIPQRARGDRTTKFRRNSFGLHIALATTGRLSGYLKYKALGNCWLKLSGQDECFATRFGLIVDDYEYYKPKFGLLAEVELNRNGFDKTKVESSKDLYRGWAITFGPELNLQSNFISFYLGIKYDFRNH